MSTIRTARWRIAFGLAGVTMALGGRMHPEADAEDSLRQELATMTAGDTWVLSHTLLAIGTALLAVGLWAAHRSRTWPSSTRLPLHVVAVTMSLYVVETLFHLASVVDSDALADGGPAPVAFTHVGLSLVLYPLTGLTFAWLNARLFRAVGVPEKVFGVIGVVAGLLHASSVPMTIVFPDAELSPMFAGAGMLFAAWSLGLGISGLRTVVDRPSVATSAAARPSDPTAYREAEAGYWRSLDAHPTEREVELPRLGVRVRVQEVGEGEPVLFVHGGPSAGTNWASLAARMPGFRCILVDRPGTGLSEPYPVTADDLDAFADVFVVDVLDALELDRAHVVASSFGGFLALRGAAVAPDRFDRMVQMACPAGATGMAVPGFMRAAAVAPVRRLITSLPPNERGARSMLRQIGHGKTVDAGGFSPEFMRLVPVPAAATRATLPNDLRMIASLVSPTGKVHPALDLVRGPAGSGPDAHLVLLGRGRPLRRQRRWRPHGRGHRRRRAWRWWPTPATSRGSTTPSALPGRSRRSSGAATSGPRRGRGRGRRRGHVVHLTVGARGAPARAAPRAARAGPEPLSPWDRSAPGGWSRGRRPACGQLRRGPLGEAGRAADVGGRLGAEPGGEVLGCSGARRAGRPGRDGSGVEDGDVGPVHLVPVEEVVGAAHRDDEVDRDGAGRRGGPCAASPSAARPPSHRRRGGRGRCRPRRTTRRSGPGPRARRRPRPRRGGTTTPRPRAGARPSARSRRRRRRRAREARRSSTTAGPCSRRGR